MAKLSSPWKCDNDTCGVLRANDSNHWLIVQPSAHSVRILPWDDELASVEGAKHCCGIDCTLKVTAKVLDDLFRPTVKETLGDA